MKRYVLTAAVFLLSVFSSVNAEIRYSVTDLGTLGGTYSSAYDINDSGHVVGTSTTDEGATRAFYYDGTSMTNLGTLGGSYSLALAINNNGQVVGNSKTAEGENHAFISNDGITMTDLGASLGLSSSNAYGINSSGHVVGRCSYLYGYVYDGDSVTHLDSLGWTTTALDINDNGQITGSSLLQKGMNTNHLVLYDNENGMTDLGTLGGYSAYGYRINNHGQIVGVSETSSFTDHAFWYDGADMIDLGTLGGTESSAHDINDNGVIVGASDIAGDEAKHAFLYDQIEGMLDLNDYIDSESGWELRKAEGINIYGQIVGYGTIDGDNHAFLLTPVPEPLTAILFGLGAVAVIRKKP